MKLYRLIPDQFCNTRRAYFHPEESLYQLGYMAVVRHDRYFGYIDPLDRSYNKLYDEKGPGMFFYTNPWDAVFCSYSLNGNRAITRVHEYNIPDDIIEESIQGLGAGYNGIRFNEVKIPYSVMKKMDGYIDELSSKLEEQIRDMNRKLYLLSEKIYRKNGFEKTADIILKFINNEEQFSNYQKNCMEAFICAIHNKSIVGDMFEITRVRDNNTCELQGINYVELVDKSKGILTYDNIPEQLLKLFYEHSYDSDYAKLLEKVKKI